MASGRPHSPAQTDRRDHPQDQAGHSGCPGCLGHGNGWRPLCAPTGWHGSTSSLVKPLSSIHPGTAGHVRQCGHGMVAAEGCHVVPPPACYVCNRFINVITVTSHCLITSRGKPMLWQMHAAACGTSLTLNCSPISNSTFLRIDPGTPANCDSQCTPR
jgi:hypothetical protein